MSTSTWQSMAKSWSPCSVWCWTRSGRAVAGADSRTVHFPPATRLRMAHASAGARLFAASFDASASPAGLACRVHLLPELSPPPAASSSAAASNRQPSHIDEPACFEPSGLVHPIHHYLSRGGTHLCHGEPPLPGTFFAMSVYMLATATLI